MKQRIWAALAVISFLIAFPKLVDARNQSETQKQSQTTAVVSSERPGSTAASSGAKNDPDYIIGPEDVLDVSVWKEAELTRTLPVRPDGKISMPLLNDVQAAGLTPNRLAQSLTEKLKKYLTAPQVTVMVSQINSQRVYVIGEVTRPGAYPMLPGMNILQAISSAGGLTQFANAKKIFLLRTVNQSQNKYPFNYKDVLDGKKPEENLQLKAGDTVVVP
jgi:polysaccharide export outer membrane protein